MPFPEIKHCLICDTVRPEPLGKLTLLGFFGIAPDVQIKLKDFTRPLELGFALVGGTGDARGEVEIQLRDSANNVLVATGRAKANAAGEGKRLLTALGITHVYPGPGRYVLQVWVEGKRHFEASFDLLQGSPTDFQA